MEIRFEDRDGFSVYGYAVETILSSAEKEVGALFENHEEGLLSIPEGNGSLYGVMWYTENHRYYYHLGIHSNKVPLDDMAEVVIPAAHFAIATIPEGMDAFEAWTFYFEEELPRLGYAPDAEHGTYFEFYDSNGNCELWTPVNMLTEG